MSISVCVRWVNEAMDITNWPKFIRKYKTQPNTNEPVEKERLVSVITLELFFCANLD